MITQRLQYTILHLVDSFAVMSFEANLPAVCPGTLDSRVLREDVEGGMVVRGQVLKHGVLIADPVVAEVSELGEGLLFVAKYDVAKKLGG